VVTLTLKRWTDLPSLGWHSGDVHMHPNHVEGGVYMTLEDCRLYAEAEDIRVANLLISSTDSAHVFDTEYFRSGKPDPLSTKNTLLVVQEEFRNVSAMYGHMPLLGSPGSSSRSSATSRAPITGRLSAQLHHRTSCQGPGRSGLLHAPRQQAPRFPSARTWPASSRPIWRWG
jgi:hypothetical protein